MDLVTGDSEGVGVGDVIADAGGRDDGEMTEVVAVDEFEDFDFHFWKLLFVTIIAYRRCMGFELPEDVAGVEDGAVGAGEFVFPVGGSCGGIGGVGVVGFVADDAGLAGAHSAGHGLFEGDLAWDVECGGDSGCGFHHGGWAAAVDDDVVEVGFFFEAILEEAAEGVGDEAFHAEGAVVGGDGGGVVELGEFFDVFDWVAFGAGGDSVGGEGEREEIVALGADEGGGVGHHGSGESVGEVEHWGDSDAAADEAGVFECWGDGEADAEGAEDGDFLSGAELSELEGSLANDAVEDFDFGVAIGPGALAGDGEGAAEVGERGVEVGVGGGGRFEGGVEGFGRGPVEGARCFVVGGDVGVGAVDLHELAGGAAGETSD